MRSVLGLFCRRLLRALFLSAVAATFALPGSSASALVMSDAEVASLQGAAAALPAGERIAFWADRFVATPYDPDPVGEYVRRSLIVADDRVDCMYHLFRSVELAFSANPAEAVQVALEKRFHGRGVLKDGFVVNYEDRFAYGEDMVFSGKWGDLISADIGPVSRMKGSRGIPHIEYIPKRGAVVYEKLRPGDLIFFVHPVHKRTRDEIVGHAGIISIDEQSGGVQLIHAGGLKGKGGAVRKVLLKTYRASMPFAGFMITRFE
ncbi:MAG: hypothetical protein FD164_1841 [Nitrospirae bacterium]|nr:MAG: hypothetical protein FD164_1841 [Nitrospirota bacterium]